MRIAIETSIQQTIAHGDDPVKVAELIVHIAETTSPRLRYRVGQDAWWAPRFKALIPESWFRFGLRKRFKLP